MLTRPSPALVSDRRFEGGMKGPSTTGRSGARLDVVGVPDRQVSLVQLGY